MTVSAQEQTGLKNPESCCRNETTQKCLHCVFLLGLGRPTNAKHLKGHLNKKSMQTEAHSPTQQTSRLLKLACFDYWSVFLGWHLGKLRTAVWRLCAGALRWDRTHVMLPEI